MQVPAIPAAMSAGAREVLEGCLELDYHKRATAHKLLSLPVMLRFKHMAVTHTHDLDRFLPPPP